MPQDSQRSCLELPVVEEPYSTPYDNLLHLYLFYSGKNSLLSKT